MKSAVFVSARMKSKRLPRKVLLDIKGKAAIEHLIDRAKLPKLTEMVVLCTSTHPDDAVLADVASRNNIECFRGSEDDKLDRYLYAAEKYGLDYVVIMDGDNIFLDPEIVDGMIELYNRTKADYITCTGLPVGAYPHGLSYKAIQRVCQIKAESDTEVWGGYFTDTGLFKVEDLEVDEELRHPEIRLTMDYQEDYELFKEIFERLYVPGKVFSLREVIRLLMNNPELMEINRFRHEQYLAHLKKSAPVRLKTKADDMG